MSDSEPLMKDEVLPAWTERSEVKPRTKNQEPRTKNQEPRTKNQEPRTKNCTAGATNSSIGAYTLVFCLTY
ncbi:MAG: hypothetical protein ACK459_11420 [Akkermansiaceae bacterium]